jgi:anti-anti-sigma factor
VAELPISIAISGDECVLGLSGEVDLACADEIARLGIGTLETHWIQRLCVDLSAVTLLDMSGLRALVRIRDTAVVRHKRFWVRDPSDAALKPIELTGLDSVFVIERAPPAQAIPLAETPASPPRSWLQMTE